MPKTFSHIILISAALSVSACSTTSAYEDTYDPLMPVNRVIHQFNKGLDTVILRPVSTVYEKAVPRTLKTVVNNEVRYLSLPRSFANSLLQGDVERAGHTAARFFTNTTLGGFGLLDPATDFNIPEHDEDFGQTLAVWGVGAGPYVELPLLGPSSARGVVGRVGDFALDPLSYATGSNVSNIGLFRRAGSIIDTRYRFGSILDEVLYDSPDSYIAVRNLYQQRRDSAILNGEYSEEDLPDISEAEDF